MKKGKLIQGSKGKDALVALNISETSLGITCTCLSLIIMNVLGRMR